MEKLRKSAVNELEEEYMKSLQEEVKILEYELKIMKDKEMERINSTSQIDKFFSDGIPLNENILALKMKYKDKMGEVEKSQQRLTKEREGEYEQNRGFVTNIRDILGALQYIQDQHSDSDKNLFDMKKDLVVDSFGEKIKKDTLERENKTLQDKLRRLIDANLKFERQHEREQFQSKHSEDPNIELNMREANWSKLIKILREKEGILVEKKGSVNMSENAEYEKANRINEWLGGQLLETEKKIGLLEAKTKEIEMTLQIRARERELEWEQKNKIKGDIRLTTNMIADEKDMADQHIQHETDKIEEAKMKEKKREIEREIRLKNL